MYAGRLSPAMLAQRVRGHGLAGGDHVRRQLGLGGAVAARDHDRFRDPGVTGEDGLDLAQLDPEAADLDLMIDPPQELDLARRPGSAPGRRYGTSARLPVSTNGSATNRSAVRSSRPR